MNFFNNDDITFCVGIHVFNDFEFLEKSLESLSETNFLKNTKIFFLDNCSSQENVKKLILQFTKDNINKVQSFYFRNNLHIDVLENNLNLIRQMRKIDSDFYVILDSKQTYNPDWLYELKKIILLQTNKNECIYTLLHVPINLKHMYFNLLEEHGNFNVYHSVSETGTVIPKEYLKFFEEELNFNEYYQRNVDGYVSWYISLLCNLRIVGPKKDFIKQLTLSDILNKNLKLITQELNKNKKNTLLE